MTPAKLKYSNGDRQQAGDSWQSKLVEISYGVSLQAHSNTIAGKVFNCIENSNRGLQLTVPPHPRGCPCLAKPPVSQEELQEIILYLRDPDRFTRLGAKLPKGLRLRTCCYQLCYQLAEGFTSILAQV